MTTKHTRRDFLKGALKGTVAASAVTTGVVGLDKLKASREPKLGERFSVWSGKNTICENCGFRGELLNGAIGIYAETKEENGQKVHVFLIEDILRCPGCSRRIGTHSGTDCKFIELDKAATVQDV